MLRKNLYRSTRKHIVHAKCCLDVPIITVTSLSCGSYNVVTVVVVSIRPVDNCIRNELFFRKRQFIFLLTLNGFHRRSFLRIRLHHVSSFLALNDSYLFFLFSLIVVHNNNIISKFHGVSKIILIFRIAPDNLYIYIYIYECAPRTGL